ncbi:putative nucleotide-binding alpha-beta plait domain, galactose oxidase, beta-propeller [Rosa chinensis]|uniref:Putative nucleotide-binding alpha-beta plait domain, galactose oxidase, beta-propeller n=1 Tax=Rosa chinensis TaxID=74649 RepID=A0A2P6SNZ8_ROSCH|nr:uncharacterized protein LOC121050978 [Rosa chinensis]PRQ60415.1 putative nucleotide-binding alpha-beta plait domain, galactose oxidase, beta-propeller [Rosa chinensis]
MEHTTAANSNADEIRSLRVEGLLPEMDAKYLYGCFSDHGQVVAATVLHNVRTGFVEFTSRSWAEMILKSYNGHGMPNFNQRYRLKWDMDSASMMWRWDYAYERCSYFGFNDAGEELNANKALLRYKHSIPAVNEKPVAAAGQQHQEDESDLVNQNCEAILYEEWCKERFLYLCMEELCKEKVGCYVIRTLNMSNLLSCSCKFDEKIGSIITCRYCADCDVPFELQKQAWLCTKDFGNRKSPKLMGCTSCFSGIMFAGGLDQSPDQTRAPYYVPSQQCYYFQPRNICNDNPEWIRRPYYLKSGKPEALLVNVDGSLCCLSGLLVGQQVAHPTFEVFDPFDERWVPLPDPPFYRPEALNYKHGDPRPGTHLSYAVMGTKLLVSSKIPGSDSPQFPVCCFDVEEKKWTEVTTLFNGKPFPFRRRALVVDLEDGTHDKVMFYFNNYFAIRVCRLVVNEDDGSIKNSPHQSLGIDTLMTSLLEITIQNQSMVKMSWDFVDLGNKKVCFVLSSSLPKGRDDDECFCHRQTLRLLILVIQFQVLESGDFSFKFLATRTFEYQGHFPRIWHPKLQGCFLL